MAHYTRIELEDIDTIRAVLQHSASIHQAKLIAVPVSSAHHEFDITYIRKVVNGYDRVIADWHKLGTPMDAIRQLAKCRIMVTGTYHGAVFSLAQGIPVVGIARSIEYFDKLSELSDEFHTGIQVLDLNDMQLASKLSRAIEDAWGSAEEIRPSILRDAIWQIGSQHLAYRRLCDSVNQKMASGTQFSGSLQHLNGMESHE